MEINFIIMFPGFGDSFPSPPFFVFFLFFFACIKLIWGAMSAGFGQRNSVWPAPTSAEWTLDYITTVLHNMGSWGRLPACVSLSASWSLWCGLALNERLHPPLIWSLDEWLCVWLKRVIKVPYWLITSHSLQKGYTYMAIQCVRT